MEDFIKGASTVLGNLPVYAFLVGGVLASLAALFAAIPGEQPEKTLYKIVNFLSKFSRKPKDETK